MNKGPDMALAKVEDIVERNNNDKAKIIVNEIKSYLNRKYVSASEAC